MTTLETRRRAAQRTLEQLTAPQRAAEAAAQELADIDRQIAEEQRQQARAATLARLAELASAGAVA